MLFLKRIYNCTTTTKILATSITMKALPPLSPLDLYCRQYQQLHTCHIFQSTVVMCCTTPVSFTVGITVRINTRISVHALHKDCREARQSQPLKD